MLGQVKDLARRARLALTKAIIEKVADATAIQLIKVEGLSGEVFEEIERPQSYGLTSNPPEGSAVVLGEIGGSRDNPIVILVDYSPDRPKNFAEGEVGLWAKFGQLIKHNEDGSTTLEAGGVTLTLDNGTLTVSGNIEASGDIDSSGTVSGDKVEAPGASGTVGLGTHTHPGVTSGGASTGPGAG